MAKGSIVRKVLIFAGAGITLLGAIVYLVFYPLHMLSIENISSGTAILETPAKPGDNLWIAFINSVENLPVADHFVIDESYRIIFSETIFQAPYAGYDRSDKAELIAPGTTKISGYNRRMEAVTFYAGDLSKHMLFLNGNWLPLYEVARGGDLIRVQIKKSSQLVFLSKRMFSHE
ncbi:MAG: DUF1850 domain-containing protein [Desulfobacteraceae bacterium]|nr:DUF1850 domain-containing protein [Desulfobacteraceae bacterium]